MQAASPLAPLVEQAREIIARYPEGKQRSALLPLLHLVQAVDGYVTPQAVAFCADLLGLSRAQVAAVATFYTMYKRRPTGDFLVSVCTNTMCDVLGGREVYDTLTEHLGVGHDETTEDGTITLEHAECLAACDYGPVLTVNYEFFDGIEPDQAVEIVEQLRAGQRPMPTRGARLCTLKEMAAQLAGYSDERAEAMSDAVPGAPTLRGNRLAERHGIAVAGFDPATPIPTHAQREAAKVAKPHPKFTDPKPDEPKAAATTGQKGAEAHRAATEAEAGLERPRHSTAAQAKQSTADGGEEAGS